MAHYLIIRCDTASEMKTFAAHMLMELIGYKLGDIEDIQLAIDSMVYTGTITMLVKDEE